jgi:hypothetical protein
MSGIFNEMPTAKIKGACGLGARPGDRPALKDFFQNAAGIASFSIEGLISP